MKTAKDILFGSAESVYQEYVQPKSREEALSRLSMVSNEIRRTVQEKKLVEFAEAEPLLTAYRKKQEEIDQKYFFPLLKLRLEQAILRRLIGVNEYSGLRRFSVWELEAQFKKLMQYPRSPDGYSVRFPSGDKVDV